MAKFQLKIFQARDYLNLNVPTKASWLTALVHQLCTHEAPAGLLNKLYCL